MVVTLSAVTLAACGDNSVNEPDQKGQGTGTDPSSAPSVPRYIP